MKKLKEIISFKGGGTPSKKVADYWNGDIPWATVKDFTSTSISATQDSITYEGLRKSTANLIPKGHVIIPTRMSLGKAALNTIDLAINQDLRALIPLLELDTKYLLYAVLSLKDQILRKGSGATVKGITQEALYDLEIYFPSLEDQKRIAHLLGKVEGAITQRKQHLQQLDDLLKSVFLGMFGDPVQNEKGWKAVSLQRGCEEIYRYPTFYGFEYSNEGIPVVRIGNILSNGDIDPNLENYVFITKEISDKYPRTILKLNDIVMAVRGDGSTGKRIGIINSGNLVGANMSPNLLRLSCKKNVFNPMYFFHFLTSERGQILITRNITRTAKKTITAENLKVISIPCPPIESQQQFAAIVEKVESVKSSYQQSLDDLEKLYGALSQKAFKGELDLSRISLPTESTESTEAENYDTSKQQQTTDTLALPAPSDLATLNSSEGRNALLDQWLTVWLERLNDEPFTTQPFMEAAQQRLSELAEDDALEWEWGASEYEQIKVWMFESLAKGDLAQTYNDTNNRVQLKAASK